MNTPVRSRSEEGMTLAEQTNSPFRSYLPFAPLNKKSKSKAQPQRRRGSNRFESRTDIGDESGSPTTSSASSGSLFRRSFSGVGNRKSNGNTSSGMVSDDDDDDVSLGSFTEIASTPVQKGGKAKLLSSSCSNLSSSCSSLCSSARRKVAQMCELSFSNLSSLAAPELDGNGLRNSGKTAKPQRFLYSIRKAKKLTLSVQEFINEQSQRERNLKAQLEDVTRLAKARHANGSTAGAVLAMRKLIALRDKVERCTTAIDTATEGLWDLEEKIRRAEKKLDLLHERSNSTKNGASVDTSKKHKSYKIDLGPNAKILEECQDILENNNNNVSGAGGTGGANSTDDDASVAPDTTMDDQSLLKQLQEL